MPEIHGYRCERCRRVEVAQAARGILRTREFAELAQRTVDWSVKTGAILCGECRHDRRAIGESEA